jgi:hypothetical protein
MKTSIVLGLFLTSFSLFASTEVLLLDASCKVDCLVSVEITGYDQGGETRERRYGNFYIDFLGLTRKEIDTKLKDVELDKLCKQNFTGRALGHGSDCLYFKH